VAVRLNLEFYLGIWLAMRRPHQNHPVVGFDTRDALAQVAKPASSIRYGTR